jgi:hypothetical protein
MSTNGPQEPGPLAPADPTPEQLAIKLETVLSFNSDHFKENLREVNHFQMQSLLP